MFHGTDSVDTQAINCPGCRQPLFVLLDETPATEGAQVQVLTLACCRCRGRQRVAVLPTMNEHAGSGTPVQPLPFQQLPPNALLCGEEAAVGKLSPQGVCHGAVFRIYDRGNELLSRCANCGHGESIGMMKGQGQ